MRSTLSSYATWCSRQLYTRQLLQKQEKLKINAPKDHYQHSDSLQLRDPRKNYYIKASIKNVLHTKPLTNNAMSRIPQLIS